MALAVALPGTAEAGWGRTLRLSGSQSRDILPAQIAFSAHGEAAVAFGTQDPVDPILSNAFAALRSPGGRVRRGRRIGAAREPLAVAFDGSRPALLTGNAPRNQVCCASAALLVAAGAGHRARRVTLGARLTGDTDGALVALPSGGLMAALSTQRGVWAAQSNPAGRLSRTIRLVSDGAPQNLAAAPLADGGSAIAWSTALGGDENAPRRIEVAFGTRTTAPHAPRVAVTVPAGHSVDEVVLAPGSAGPTLAWVESWFDGLGGFHSRVQTALAVRSAHGRAVSPAGELASGLSIAAGPTGRQVLVWEGCDELGACVARAASRPRSGVPFGRTQRLGAADGGEPTAAAVSVRGVALVSWVDGGNVLAAARGVGARAFGPRRTVSDTGLDADPTLAFGPGATALAAWTQGTLAPSVFARTYSAG